MDNCPDHGPAIAGLAESAEPDVYAAGVWGHDHLVAAPAPSDSGFEVARLPVAVLFARIESAAEHITTIAQLNQAIAAGHVTTIQLPAATFYGSSVSEAAYTRGAPVPAVPPLP